MGGSSFKVNEPMNKIKHKVEVRLSHSRTAVIHPPKRGEFSTELSVTIKGGGEKAFKSSYSSEEWINGLTNKDISAIDMAARRFEGGFKEGH